LEQQPGQFGMMSDACRTVERAFPLGLGLVILFEEAGVGVGARIEQSRGGLEKALGSGRLEPQKLGEAKVRQRVPIARTAFGVAFAVSADRKRPTASSSPSTAAVWISLLATSGCSARISFARSSEPCHTDTLMNSALGSWGEV